MAKRHDIVPGDRVDLQYKNSPEYRALVEEAGKKGNIVVTSPTYRGVPVVFHRDQILRLSFYRDNGKYSMDVKVRGFSMSNEIRLVELECVSDVTKVQRRGYYRLPVVLRTEVRRLPVALPTELHRLPEVLPMLDDVMSYEEAVDALEEYAVDEENSTTRDISISGISVKSKTNFVIGDKLVIKVHLGWPDATEPPIAAVVEVRRVEYDPTGGIYNVGLEFAGAFAKRDVITRYIYEQQQKRIRQEKLIKDE
ncbi:MAG: PilZ domain-containing protein [Oscillospiraceae bacterium]|jgi:c-di-GMP-binding flagellar brake protein YcgR|nr:PilZ domain-containing protein [Oscillospiraceae bacterium]